MYVSVSETETWVKIHLAPSKVFQLFFLGPVTFRVHGCKNGEVLHTHGKEAKK